jgi:transposase
MDASFKAAKYGVGIDMGKDKFYVCISAIDTTQRIKIKATHAFANTPKGIAEFHRWCEHHGKEKQLPIQYVMEATGVYYEQLALSLHQRGAYVCVVLPQKAKHYVKALGLKSKTDGVDAQALSTMSCQQSLPAWQPISEAMYKLRQLTRQQIDLQNLKTQIGNQLMSLELGMYQAKEVKKQMNKLLDEIESQITECEKLIAKAVNDNAEWKRKVEQICAIKGVGLLTVANLITETNEFALFENQRQLVSYAGYDVVENQSGKRVGKTRISKRGNARIRRGLHMAALMVVRYEQRPFVGLYERVFERTKIKMKGYVAVQRKLLTLVYALWKKDEKYEGDFVSERQKKVAPTEGATLHRPEADVLKEVNILELVES